MTSGAPAEPKGAKMADDEAKPIRVGMKLRDNDPRVPERVMVVHEVRGEKIVLRHPVLGGDTHRTTISARRVFTDDKPRRNGWSVVR